MNDMQETPRGWIRATVADIAELVQYGSSAKTSEASTGVPVLRMGNIVGGRLELSDLKYLPRSHHEFPELLLAPGDMLFNRTNSAELVGKTAVYAGSPRECSFASYLLRVRLTNYEPILLSAYINSPAGREWIASVVNQQVGQANVNGSKLRELEVPVPPFREQRRIVAKLEALTEKSRRAKEALDAIPPLLERFRQSVLAAAFRGDLTAEWRAKNPDIEPADKLLQRIRTERRRRWEEAELAKMQAKGKTPSDDRWKEKYEEPEPVDAEGLPELPEGWAWTSLAAVTDSTRLIRYGILMPGPDYPGGIPYVKVLHMKGDTIEATALPRTSPEMHEQFIGAALAKGDLLLSIRGTFGRVVEVPDSLEGANITQDSARLAPMPGLSRNYFAMALRGPGMQSHFRHIAKGVAVRGLNITDIRMAPIAVAPEAEQQLVTHEVTRMLVKLERWKEGVTASQPLLTQLDRSILAKAFRGDLVPQDPSDEPASVLLDRIRRERAAAELAKDKKAPKRPR